MADATHTEINTTLLPDDLCEIIDAETPPDEQALELVTITLTSVLSALCAAAERPLPARYTIGWYVPAGLETAIFALHDSTDREFLTWTASTDPGDAIVLALNQLCAVTIVGD